MENDEGPEDVRDQELEEPWLSSVTIGDYPGLGGDITIELSRRCTVLVGRNGAGKSLILDALQSVQWGPNQGAMIPNRLQCTICVPTQAELRYQYQRTERQRPARLPTTRDAPRSFALAERAWKKESGEETELWRFEGGVATLSDGREIRTNDGFLPMAYDVRGGPSRDAVEILQSLGPVTRISSGAPRVSETREEIFHRIIPGAHGYGRDISSDPAQTSRVHQLSFRLASEGRGGFSNFEDFEAAARRVGAASSIRIVSYDSAGGKEKDASNGICEVVVDGVNIGLQSDGTLRVLEVLSALHFGPPHTLLEEPETGIHPGLLARLLRELESYEGQVIISTHSPQVVSWAKPEEIRLVERKEGKTTVRGLTPQEIERVHEYLSHDGTLGEFVYGGALDEED